VRSGAARARRRRARSGGCAAARGPKGLKAFLLRVNEPETLWNRTFPRTPAFAWSPVRGAKKYEFELSTSRNFSEGAIVWSSADSSSSIATPATSVPVALPWITGNPYSLYARARGIGAKGRVGLWSAPYGFNMRWRDKPRRLDPQFPGLVRWTPVEGATVYEVWLYGARETFFTTTNIADEREFYTFHASQFWTGAVHWRVRAVRRLYGEIPNGLPAVTVGPWSDELVNLNPPFALGELAQIGSVSGGTLSTPSAPQAHELTPGFIYSGNYRSWGLPWFQTTTTELFRVYVSTDSECVNRVYVGAVVGSPRLRAALRAHARAASEPGLAEPGARRVAAVRRRGPGADARRHSGQVSRLRRSRHQREHA
jgi:hypothetical protein